MFQLCPELVGPVRAKRKMTKQINDPVSSDLTHPFVRFALHHSSNVKRRNDKRMKKKKLMIISVVKMTLVAIVKSLVLPTSLLTERMFPLRESDKCLFLL